MTLTFRTLFSGGELFGVGARAAGWQHVDGYELRPDIAAVAQRNGFDVRAADVCDLDYTSLVPVTHEHYSPSCKTASSANPDAGETEGDLACADAICWSIAAHRGRSVSLENVWAYRNFESFARILVALHAAGFVVDYAHINSADYGVPQTRKRLILRAVRRTWRAAVPPLEPTHRRGGDLYLLPWPGWYAAIADILDTLPPTEPAPWQAARMPKAWHDSFLIAQGGYENRVAMVPPDDPAFTITANHNQQTLRAFLLDGTNSSNNDGLGTCREGAMPSFTIGASVNKGMPRAYIVGGGNTTLDDLRPSHARADDEPMFTVRDGRNGSPERAFLIDGRNGRPSLGRPTIVAGDDPAFTLGASKAVHRGVIAGRWVRMTVQALGRFQTVPNSYQGLTSEINGNGVPPLLSQRIMESLSSLYEQSE